MAAESFRFGNWHGHPEVAMTVLSPRWGFCRFLAPYPQLALWAAFFRRFAAQAGFAPPGIVKDHSII